MDRSKLKMQDEWSCHVKGEDHPQAKLTKEDVVDVIHCYLDGYTLASIARAAGVSATQIRSILNGESWRWFTGIWSSQPIIDHPEHAIRLFHGPDAPLKAYARRSEQEVDHGATQSVRP